MTPLVPALKIGDRFDFWRSFGPSVLSQPESLNFSAVGGANFSTKLDGAPNIFE